MKILVTNEDWIYKTYRKTFLWYKKDETLKILWDKYIVSYTDWSKQPKLPTLIIKHIKTIWKKMCFIDLTN